jgi:hypothetical protein
MSAFFLYSQAFRAQVKEENPDASFGDVVSVSFPFPMFLLKAFPGGFVLGICVSVRTMVIYRVA